MIQTAKILNLLQKQWFVIDSQTTKGKYKQGNAIKFEVETIKSSLCDYSDAFVLATGNIAVNAANDTDVAFKNCAPFSTCKTVINDVLVYRVEDIYIETPMYNLIEYSNNYSDTSGRLWQFKRDEVPANNADLTINNSQSFKCKAETIISCREKTAYHNNEKSSVEDRKIVVPLKYLSNFWRSLEMSIINCKVHLELN